MTWGWTILFCWLAMSAYTTSAAWLYQAPNSPTQHETGKSLLFAAIVVVVAPWLMIGAILRGE